MRNITEPMTVAIECMTYNQKPYILDALNGFIMQKTTFPFIIILVDDASTDGEKEVIQKFIGEQFDVDNKCVAYTNEDEDAYYQYARHKYNENCYIIYLSLKHNLYQNPRKKELFSEWEKNVKYIAICEGDDYWTAPLKLQKQVDYLEEHTDCGLVCTGCTVTKGKSNNIVEYRINHKNEISFVDILIKNEVNTLTVCFRGALISDYLPLPNLLMGDYPLWLHILTKSNGYQIPEYMANYRELEGSASRPRQPIDQLKFLYDTLIVREHFAKQMNCMDLIHEELRLMFYYVFEQCYTNQYLNFPINELKTKVRVYKKISYCDYLRFWGLRNKFYMKLSKDIIMALKHNKFTAKK